MTKLWNKYKQIIAYLFWGVLTTAVDIMVAVVCMFFFPQINIFWNTLIAWILSVIFAFFTNRKWVFQSKASSLKQSLQEMLSFSFGRFASLVLEEIILNIGGIIFGNRNFNIIKIVGQIVVIVFNYFWSKFVVFVNHQSK